MSKRVMPPNEGPDMQKIPKSLRTLAWEPWSESLELFDGDQLLAAVPVCIYSGEPNRGWYYELSVVTVDCDEGHFALNLSGESWGWDVSDIELLVRL